MLKFFGHPGWCHADGRVEGVPATLPGALLLLLASRDDWMRREEAAVVLWPDAAHEEALHRLRLTLHRLREWLAARGCGGALVAERTRVRLDLPSDLRALRLALAADGQPLDAAMAGFDPGQWLLGWRTGGPGFEAWSSQTLQQLVHQRVQQRQRPHRAAGSARADAHPTGPDAAAPSPPAPSGRPAGASPWPAPAPRPPLAGRGAEQHALESALASGTPAVVVMGEAGIGKSTLLAHALPGAWTLRGREVLRDSPYRVLADALRSRGDELAHALARASGSSSGHGPGPLAPYRLDLARLLPELAPAEALPPLEPELARARLAEGLALAFEVLGGCLVIDDLHWCDESTLAWLGLVAHRGRPRWCAATREPAPGSAAERLLGALEREQLLCTLPLAPMPADALAEALAGTAELPGLPPGAAPAAPSAPSASAPARPVDWQRLAEESGGNPFLARELLAARHAAPPDAHAAAGRVARVLRQVIDALAPAARGLCEAAAVLGEPAPPAALASLAGLAPEGAASGDALDAALAARVLQLDERGRLACRHDLLRQTLLDRLTPLARTRLNAAAAEALEARAGWQPGDWEPQSAAPAAGWPVDPRAVAAHWLQAHQPQRAWPWQHEAAQAARLRGEFELARRWWAEVALHSTDPLLAESARLELAAAVFFDDLAESRAALGGVMQRLAVLPPGPGRDTLRGRALAALVDNRVFAGDLVSARGHARELVPLLAALPAAARLSALESLMELAMREPDEAACERWIGAMQALAPDRAATLSLHSQMHWFLGDVRAACETMSELLRRHPDFCRGLTIENDLAVNLHALGRMAEAEDFCRRSLASWAGVPHVEALSLLVLGTVLTSRGREDEAAQAFERSLVHSRAHASAAFEAEALMRHARLELQRGALARALALLQAARPLVADSTEPLRVSQWALLEALCEHAGGPAAAAERDARLAEASARSRHPLVRVRVAAVEALRAMAAGHMAVALARWREAETVAADAGLLEHATEARLRQLELQAAAGPLDAAHRALLAEVQATAGQAGLVPLLRRARACETALAA